MHCVGIPWEECHIRAVVAQGVARCTGVTRRLRLCLSFSKSSHFARVAKCTGVIGRLWSWSGWTWRIPWGECHQSTVIVQEWHHSTCRSLNQGLLLWARCRLIFQSKGVNLWRDVELMIWDGAGISLPRITSHLSGFFSIFTQTLYSTKLYIWWQMYDTSASKTCLKWNVHRYVHMESDQSGFTATI